MQLDEYFKQTHNEYGIDRTLLIERLRVTPTQRLLDAEIFLAQIEELRRTAKIIPHDSISQNHPKSRRPED